ncbi:hypothetical protein HZS_3051 [Henneguya salminicola]|nr:hypothetical protein HZS_3051 [Henneguya salminicola]
MHLWCKMYPIKIIEDDFTRIKIISDGWKAYTQLNQYGYDHEVIIHSEDFVHPDNPEIHTQPVENMWGVIKRFIRKHGTNRSPHEFEYMASRRCIFLVHRSY